LELIRILLVEDDPFWQHNLTEDLNKEPDLQVVRVASTKEEAVKAAHELEIDIVLMDINLSDNRLDGLEATREIYSSVKRDMKVIMLTSLEDRSVITQSFQSGAVNFMNKSSFADVVQTIRNAHANKAGIHQDAAAALISEVQMMALTPTEREVFDLWEQGYNKSEIASMLHKSFHTIKSQLKSIKSKLTFRPRL